MAIFESGGYGLRTMFVTSEIAYGLNISEHWYRIKKLLGDRVDCMIYQGKKEKGRLLNGYITDVFAGSKNSTLGIEVASSLRTMFPISIYGKVGKPIIVTDHPDTSQVPDFIFYDEADSEWKVKNNPNELNIFIKCKIVKVKADNIAVFEDERYLVVLVDDDETIQMKIYKKT